MGRHSKAVAALLVLGGGAAALALWATSPACQGAFCLGAREQPVPREQAQESAGPAKVTTEELERIWQEAAPAEQAEAAPAEPAPAQVGATLGPSDDGAAGLEDVVPDGDDRPREGGELINPEVVEVWEAAAFAAVNEPDDQLREQAIGEVGLLRNGESVAVLLDVAFGDPVADNRYIALETLWYSAADGLDADGVITTALRDALRDPDPRVAKLAEKALADLAKLAARQDAD